MTDRIVHEKSRSPHEQKSKLVALLSLFAAVAVAVLFAPSPAKADSYVPCESMVSNVSVGATSKKQSITCVQKPICGESWGQVYDVTWNMTVQRGGITVKSVTLKVTHPSKEDIRIGHKQIKGANRSLSLASGYNLIGSTNSPWTKTFNNADTYFTKHSDGTVRLMINFEWSGKPNGCETTAKKVFLFALKIV